MEDKTPILVEETYVNIIFYAAVVFCMQVQVSAEYQVAW